MAWSLVAEECLDFAGGGLAGGDEDAAGAGSGEAALEGAELGEDAGGLHEDINVVRPEIGGVDGVGDGIGAFHEF